MANAESFLPSRHGFAFTNAFPPQPAMTVTTPLGKLAIGNAAGGLCGGMVFAVLDYWHAGVLPPADRPTHGEPLFRFLVRRLLHSWHLPVGVARYYRWMMLPDGDRDLHAFGRRLLTRRGVTRRTTLAQWRAIAAELDRGIPVPLGVVTIASRKPTGLPHNHQVLAFGYEVSGGLVTIGVYDPNQGPRDDIVIRFAEAGPDPAVFTHNLGIDGPVRGFFRTGYTRRPPPPA
jgi:hypothetical protein